MKLEINNEICNPELLTFSEKTYGKTFGNEYKFYLEGGKTDFYAKFDPIYKECIEELQRDDKITGLFHPPYHGASEYPTLDKLFELPADQRMEFVNTYFALDILRIYFQEEAINKRTQWCVVRSDSIHLDDQTLVLRGTVCRLPTAI
jgi:hypothetical protein